MSFQNKVTLKEPLTYFVDSHFVNTYNWDRYKINYYGWHFMYKNIYLKLIMVHTNIKV